MPELTMKTGLLLTDLLEIKGADGTVYDSEQIYNAEEELGYSDWGDMFKDLTAGRTVKAKFPREKSLVADTKIMIAEGENGRNV